MGSFSKYAFCAVLPLTLALAAATCIAQPTEDSRLGGVAQADTPTGSTTSSTTTSAPLCSSDGGALAAYYNAVQGSPYWGSSSATGWGSLGPSYTSWGGWGPSYGAWGGWGGSLTPAYEGLGFGGYYYGSPYGYGYGSPYYGGAVLTEPTGCQ